MEKNWAKFNTNHLEHGIVRSIDYRQATTITTKNGKKTKMLLAIEKNGDQIYRFCLLTTTTTTTIFFGLDKINVCIAHTHISTFDKKIKHFNHTNNN